MSENNLPVTVTILDKDYRIACPRDEKDGLLASAEYLNRHIKEIRNSGKVVGADRIAVLAALNITHELLTQRTQTEHIGVCINRLRDRLGTALDEEK
jgi:cell division protein ZapA